MIIIITIILINNDNDYNVSHIVLHHYFNYSYLIITQSILLHTIPKCYVRIFP